MELAARLDQIDERLRRVEARLFPKASDAFGKRDSDVATTRMVEGVAPIVDSVSIASIARAPATLSAIVPATPWRELRTRVSDTAVRSSSEMAPLASGIRPRERPRPKTSIDYERFVGVAVLGRVGIAAVLLAAGYFGQLGWREIGPWARVATIYGLAAVFITVGAVLRTKVSRLYLSLLWGGGAAAMYIAGVLARLHFELVGPTTALGMLVASCAVAQFLALKVRFQALAITALVGAFAAPVLVANPVDARTALMIYLLALHTWGAFTEAKFGWKGARFVGVLGTGIVAMLWLGRHGDLDVSTYVHLHVYFLGLTAPEWGRGVLGQKLSPTRTTAFLISAIMFEALAFLPPFVAGSISSGPGSSVSLVRSVVLPTVALVWSLFAWVARARTSGLTPMSTALARLAAFLLVPAALLVVDQRGLSSADAKTFALANLAGVSVALLLARARYGLKDVGPTAAGLVSLALVSAANPGARFLLALVPAIGLVGWGRRDFSRSAGFALGIATLILGLPVAATPVGVAEIFGACATFWLVARTSLRTRPSDVFACVLDLSLVAGTVAWIVLALADGPFVSFVTPVWNAGTAAALGLAATIVLRAPWRVAKGLALDAAPLVSAALVALVGCSAWRELHAALSAHAAGDTQAAVETLFFCGAAVAALLAGKRTGERGFWALAIGLIVLGYGRSIESLTIAGSAWWIVGEIVALGATSWSLAATSPPGRAPERIASIGGVLAGALLWLAADSAHRWGGSTFILHPRLVAGVLVAFGLACSRFQVGKGLPRGLAVVAGLASALVGFEAGRLEVVKAVTALDSESWKDALGSLYTAVFASALLAVGFARRAADLRWLALAGFGVLVFKVAFHDLANVSTPLRILITGCFGVILLLAAYSYARRRRADSPAAIPVPPPDPEQAPA